jgi:hypothetical protein
VDHLSLAAEIFLFEHGIVQSEGLGQRTTAGEGELFDGVITLDNTPLEHKRVPL